MATLRATRSRMPDETTFAADRGSAVDKSLTLAALVLRNAVDFRTVLSVTNENPFTVTELARRADVQRSTARAWLCGERNAHGATKEALEKAFAELCSEGAPKSELAT